jgi:ribonuclease R
LGGNAKPGDIRSVIEGTRERAEFNVISTLALRSMQKARYDAQPLGHYGLAMEDYCHFTSPIRRYPDLVVSRAITAMLTGKRATLTGDKLDDAAMRSSDCERSAVEAERAAEKMMMARFMASHVGEEFDGVISGVTDFGLYVELSNGAEGFIHVRTLDDWFDYDDRRMLLRGERSGAVFALGQQLRVRVQSVELAQSAVDLELAGPLVSGRREKSYKKQERERMRAFRF